MRDDFSRDRDTMVEDQIAARGVRDPRVLAAMRKVPRHRFVAEAMTSYAYQDEPLPIGEGQTISQPYIVAYMSEVLELRGAEKILEIGTGSGYQTAVLAELAKDVYTIELVESLSLKAQEVITALGYTNVHFKIGDGTIGWKEHSPYDAIVVTAAPGSVPKDSKISWPSQAG